MSNVTIPQVEGGEDTSPARTVTLEIDNGSASKYVQLSNLLKNYVASPAQGQVLYYDGSNWVALSPGTSGQMLKTQGAGANPAWALPADLAISSQAQGDILYFNGTNWVRLAAGTSGYVLQTNGTGANPSWVELSSAGGISIVKAIAGGTKTSNSTTETTLETYTIPGGSLYAGSVNHAYRIKIRIEAFNNRGSSDNGMTVRCKWNGSTIFTFGAVASALSNNTYELYDIEFVVAAEDGASAQSLHAWSAENGAVAAGTPDAVANHFTGVQTATVNTASDAAIAITGQLPFASASEWMRVVFSKIEKITNYP